MAASNPQREFLTLIRDYASEKSQGERRVVNLKKRIQELRSEIDSACLELEEAKRLKENIEQEIKGYEVELSVNDASIQTLEARISLIQDEISTIGSDLDALKKQEDTLREDFINTMFELNAKIRKFQQMVASVSSEVYQAEKVSKDGSVHAYALGAQQVEGLHENTDMISKINEEQQDYQSKKRIHMQLQEELGDLEKRISLMEAIMKESKELQELTMQTSKLEEACAGLSDELQKRCLCPRCHQDNADALGGLLQTSSRC